MRSTVCLVSVLMLAVAVAEGDSDSEWFVQDYGKLDPRTWLDGNGTWRGGADFATCHDGVVDVDARDGELVYSPPSDSAPHTRTVMEAMAMFTACSNGAENDPGNTASSAGLSLRRMSVLPGAPVSFIGLTKFGWVALACPGLVPREGVWYRVKIELDLSASPDRVRYSVDGTTLCDADGVAWFTANTSGVANTPIPVTTVEKESVSDVVFRGCGSVGTFEGRQSSFARGVPRAEIVLAFPERPTVGSVLGAAIVTNEASGISGDVRCVWRLVDGTGVREDAHGTSGGLSYVPVEDDYAHWIEADVFDDNGYVGTGRTWFSKLPVAVIRTSTGCDPSPEMVDGDRVPLEGTLFLSGNGVYGKQYEGAVEIKVRGNSTAWLPKRPYKIKLDKKADLFGLGNGVKNKHWVLLANYYDESLLRNKVASDLSGELGLVNMKSTWVDVIQNGNYLGCYQLCQHIRVGEDRVNVFDWESAGEEVADSLYDAVGKSEGWSKTDKSALEGLLSTDFSWISTGRVTYREREFDVAGLGGYTGDVSGGYLFESSLEMDAQSQFEFACGGSGTRIQVMVNAPESIFTDPSAAAFCQDYWSRMGDSWTSGTGYNASGEHYSDLADIDTMVAYWLTMYIVGNDDAAAKSRYAYKDRGQRLRFGPVWDFDWGCGSVQVRTWITDPLGRVRLKPPCATGWMPSDSGYNWMLDWCCHPWFVYRLRKGYWRIRPYLDELLRDGGIIDGHVAYLRESAKANEDRWRYRIGFGGDEGDVASFKRYLKERVAWLDGEFATVGSSIASICSASRTPWRIDPKLGVAIRGGKPLAGSGESILQDLAVRVTLAPIVVDFDCGMLKDAHEVDAYVNGKVSGHAVLDSGRAVVDLPASLFRAGETNLVSFIARDADANILARNVVLVEAGLPDVLATEDGGHDVPVDWALDVWRGMARRYPSALTADDQLATYASFIHFVTNASPIGKSVPPWEDFVSGADPLDVDSVFRATISIDASGTPIIGWSPDLSEGSDGLVRSYDLLGSPVLGGGWAVTDARFPDEEFLRSNRFFRVRVRLKDVR